MKKIIEDWKNMDGKYKAIIIALIVIFVILVIVQSLYREKLLSKSIAVETQNNPAASVKFQALPNTNRNQGLEDLSAQISKLNDEVSRLRFENQNNQGKLQTTSPSSKDEKIDLNKNLPPPGGVVFDVFAEDKTPATLVTDGVQTKGKEKPILKDDLLQESISIAQIKVWQADKKIEEVQEKEPKLIIPVNSALEAVMLSGINARPPGSISGAIGSVNSANDVGAPFVTRIKGDATLPNGWKLSDLGDCFLGGSGIAILSAERAYVISNTISCIAANGEVYEAPVKAYGLDIDGIQGVAGKVVSKQGAILFQALLTGLAGGLGAALSPTPIPAYNSSAQSGSTQGAQFPDPNLLARTAIGSGINNATSQLSRFYLEFARETFPVIEVVAGTRVTWILKESVEFKKIKKAGE